MIFFVTCAALAIGGVGGAFLTLVWAGPAEQQKKSETLEALEPGKLPAEDYV